MYCTGGKKVERITSQSEKMQKRQKEDFQFDKDVLGDMREKHELAKEHQTKQASGKLYGCRKALRSLWKELRKHLQPPNILKSTTINK